MSLSDDRLRHLEREAKTDPRARFLLWHELARRGDVAEVERFLRNRIEHSAVGDPHWNGAWQPSVAARQLALALREFVDRSVYTHSGFAGGRVLRGGFKQRAHTGIVLVVRDGEALTFGFGECPGGQREASPGRAWKKELGRWSTACPCPPALKKRLLAWAAIDKFDRLRVPISCLEGLIEAFGPTAAAAPVGGVLRHGPGVYEFTESTITRVSP